MAIKLSTSARNAMLDGLTATVSGSAKLRIYDGTQPAGGPGTAVTTQVLLAELTCNATFAPAASGGVLTLNSITQATAAATGTASWFRIVTSGNTAVIDGSVSTSGADMNLNSTSIVSGGTVSITSATFTAGNA